VLFDDWSGLLDTVESGYDSTMNASFFLCPSRNEVVILGHSTKTALLMEGANFVGCSGGQDPTDGIDMKAFFITATGLIVTPDDDADDSGTMWGLSSNYTLNGTVDYGGMKNKIYDMDATFHADMVGSLLYMTNGDNAGESAVIDSIDDGTTDAAEDPNFDGVWADPGASWSVAAGVATGLVGADDSGNDLILQDSLGLAGAGTVHKVVIVINSDNSATFPTGGIYVGFDNANWSAKLSGAGTHTVYTQSTTGTFMIRLAQVVGYTCELESHNVYLAAHLELATNLTNNMAAGDTFAVSPVPFKLRFWPLRYPQRELAGIRFLRWVITSLAVKCRKLVGFTDNVNNQFRVGAYRNSGDTIHQTTAYVDVTKNPADAAGRLNIDGIDLEPYVEQLSCGTSFELTNIEVGVTISWSRNVTAG
jgi:hypothetical protein